MCKLSTAVAVRIYYTPRQIFFFLIREMLIDTIDRDLKIKKIKL